MDFVEDYTVVDLEMTGLAVKKDKIIEIGAIKVRNGKVVDEYSTLVNPCIKLDKRIVKLTGITDEMLQDAPKENDTVNKLIEFIGDDVLVGQNINFDYGFIKQWALNNNVKIDMFYCDTLKIARKMLPAEQEKNLEALCKYFGISRDNVHRALDDAYETMQVYEKFKEMISEISKDDVNYKIIQKCFFPRKFNIKIKKQTPATKKQLEQLHRYLDGNHLNEDIKKQIEEQINWETLTRSEASRIMDKLYSRRDVPRL